MLAGALLLASVTLLFGCAWRLGARGRWIAAVACVVMAALGLRAFASADPHLHEWDERYHAVVAKNMRAHPLRPTLYDDPLLLYDHRNPYANHVWLHKPPLALWLMALGIEIAGHTELAVRLPSLLVSTASVLVTWRLGSLLFDARIGLLAAMLHAINGFLIEVAAGRRSTDHVDTLFIALVEVGMWSAFRGARLDNPVRLAPLLGAITGLALLTKGPAALLLVFVWAVLVGLQKGRRALSAAALALATALAVALPWNLYAQMAFPAEYTWERRYDLLHLFEVVEGHRGSPLSHFTWMGRFFGELVYLPVAAFLYATVRDRSPERVAIALWMAVPYAVFSLASTKMPGYPMIAAPAVFLATAWFWWWLRDRMAVMGRRWPAAVVLALLVALPARFTYERVRPFATRREPAWTRDLRALGREVGGGPCALFNVPRPVEAMFYTPCTAYPSPPGHATVDRLLARGYRVIVGDDGRLTADLRAREDVRFVGLSN